MTIFYRTYVLYTFLLLAGITGLITYLFSVNAQDQETYRELMEHAQGDLAASQKPYRVEQVREGSSKIVLLTCGNERQIGKLACTDSSLTYSQDGSLVERMKNVSVIYQETLSENSQQLVQLEAKEAIYFYRDAKLNAQKVELKRYTAQGHVLPKDVTGLTPFSEGVAASIDLELGKEAPVLKAKQLKLTLREKDE